MCFQEILVSSFCVSQLGFSEESLVAGVSRHRLRVPLICSHVPSLVLCAQSGLMNFVRWFCRLCGSVAQLKIHVLEKNSFLTAAMTWDFAFVVWLCSLHCVPYRSEANTTRNLTTKRLRLEGTTTAAHTQLPVSLSLLCLSSEAGRLSEKTTITHGVTAPADGSGN